MELEKFRERFGTDKQCREYIGKLRWKDGFLCPICFGREAWVTGKVEYKCKNESCKHHKVSVTSGTIFDGSHIPLPKWFEMIWYLCENGFRCSAAELQEKFCLGSNRTAQRVKRELSEVANKIYFMPTKHKLKGTVEVSAPEITVRKRRIHLIVAAEIQGKRVGNIRAKYFDERENLTNQVVFFLQEFVDTGSTLICKLLFASNPLFKGDEAIYKKEIKQDTYNFPYTKKAASALESWLPDNFGFYKPDNYIIMLNHYIMRYCSYLENCGNPIPFDSFMKIAVQTKTPVRLKKDEEKEKARRQESAGE